MASSVMTQHSLATNEFRQTEETLHEDESITFTEDVRRIWSRSAADSSLGKDLPRLAHRITVRTRNGRAVLPPTSDQAGAMGPVETWALVARLAKALVEELEPHREPDVQEGLRRIGERVTSTSDLELVLPELVRLLGQESRALKVLNMVDQRVVLLGVFHLKEGVTRGLHTKDVRSTDGWQIGIDVFDQVQVYHRRREQSVDVVSGANNHFELEFEVRATFRRDMAALTAAGLRVQRLVCAPTMQPEFRAQLETQIPGELIVL